HTWIVDLHPGVEPLCRLVLTGSVGLGGESGVVKAMPVVSVDAEGTGGSAPVPTLATRTLLALSGELSAETPSGVTMLRDPPAHLTRWPRAAAQIQRTGGQVWAVGAPDWHMQLVPRQRTEQTAAVEVLLAEQMAVMDGQHWLHEAVW